MNYQTGQTINDIFVSTDVYNNPVYPANFTVEMFQNGNVISTAPENFSIQIADMFKGIYSYSFIPTQTGNYQVYINNLNTNIIYVSDIFIVSNSSSDIIYVGL